MIKISRRKKSATTIKDVALPQILHDIFINRGVKTRKELELNIKNLLPIGTLANANKAALMLLEAINQQKQIVIIADFDADGATACALLLKVLRQLKAKVTYQVPNRVRHGYGLSSSLLNEILDLKPDLLLTVDNGISSFGGIKLARENNIDVIVTDHHLPAAELPDANVIVNPNLEFDTFKSKNLSGVGVAFYLSCALHRELENDDWYVTHDIEPLKPLDLLPLVALGTVADVVPLDHNNRILINSGLKKIRVQNCPAGIRALFKVVEVDIKYATASDIAFKIAPRINAAGRMEDISIGIECLSTEDEAYALRLAVMLHEINLNRQNTEKKMQDEAAQIVADFKDSDSLPFGLCLYKESWHEGIVGIVAGRLKDKLHRPVIVFAASGNKLKGSARSIRKINIRDAIDSIDKQYPEIIEKFGGHAMAAGLTISPDNLGKFATAFDAVIKQHLKTSDLTGEIFSDGELAEDLLTLQFADTLENISPWGQDFPEPIFDGMFKVLEQRIVGQRHLKLIVKLDNSTIPLDAIAFNHDILTDTSKPIKISYRLGVNRWRENTFLQLVILHIL